MTNFPPPLFTMLRLSYSSRNVVRYRCNNIVLGGKGGANTKSQKFLHLIVSKQIAKQILVSIFVLARENTNSTLHWPSNIVMLLDSNNSSNEIIMSVTSL